MSRLRIRIRPDADLNQPRAAGQDPARAIDDERVVEEILDGEEHRRRPDRSSPRCSTRCTGDQAPLTVRRRRDRVEIVAELLARAHGLDRTSNGA